ncbi:hypothetical protein Rhe02_71840 [Rhizocola hellebori]|uniref:Uncharacterized protein n=1 Tax=Rhizocola hellebori TaxID=1392758 RepID=A0A8J3VK35_9ACTN|nr:hypothetical protein Rhe02_71840 [Rhizocola hellebori]
MGFRARGGPAPDYVALSHYSARVSYDDERVVELDDDLPVLVEQTRDDTPAGWGERETSNDDRLLDERPPHWD